MSSRRKLTPRQQRFVEEYLIDVNASQAAIRAGFSNKESGSCGARLLRHPVVGEAVRQAMADRSARTGITADRVLREYARIAFADIRNFTAKGTKGLKTVAELSDDEAAAVQELTGHGEGARVKLHDKKKALDALARHLGLFRRGQEPAESPSAAAERIRELILARHARLIEHRDVEGDPPEDS